MHPGDRALGNHPIRSSEVRRWLGREFLRGYGTPPNAAAMEQALDALEARAQFDGPEEEVFVRVASYQGDVVIDLCNKDCQVLRVGAKGVQILNNSPVRFRRTKGMAPLPYPAPNGSIDDLRPFVNLADEEGWVLLVGCLIGALRPKGPFPCVEISGPQGAAKSTTSKVMRSLVDPNISPLRSRPKDERDLFISASNEWMPVFDNLSGISDWMSDALCRIATGGGFSTRKLYADDEEMLFEVCRPIIFNGIEDQAIRGDLLDRTITLPLARIPEEKRRDEATFWKDFEAARPSIFGGLLAAVSVAIRNFDSVKLERVPRMADFTRWVTAAEPQLGWAPGTFLRAYDANREAAQIRVVEANPVVTLLIELATAHRTWRGTSTDLLQALVGQVGYRPIRLPANANALGGLLKRVGPTLQQYGIRVQMDREGHQGKRMVELQVTENVVSVVSAVSKQEGEHETKA